MSCKKFCFSRSCTTFCTWLLPELSTSDQCELPSLPILSYNLIILPCLILAYLPYCCVLTLTPEVCCSEGPSCNLYKNATINLIPSCCPPTQGRIWTTQAVPHLLPLFTMDVIVDAFRQRELFPKTERLNTQNRSRHTNGYFPLAATSKWKCFCCFRFRKESSPLFLTLSVQWCLPPCSPLPPLSSYTLLANLLCPSL